MDISIAVSLIRGQMGAVVEQAVNGAVETVLAEMLKVVGVKFEELKAQLAHMKRDVVALQREKALKEKENDNIRAKLRYTELKLKYYRQGVEEELQHRASSSSSLVRGHPSKLSPGQTGGAGISSTGASPACSSQTLVVDDPAVRSTRECTSPQRASQHNNKAAAVFESADSLLAVSLPVSTEALESSDQDVPQENDWNVTVHDAAVAPPPAQTLTQQSSTVPPQADSSTAQVKMEEEEEEQQVICIKEEPEEEQEVMSCLLLDDQMNHGHMAQSEMSATQRLALEACQRKCSSGFSSAGPPTSCECGVSAGHLVAPHRSHAPRPPSRDGARAVDQRPQLVRRVQTTAERAAPAKPQPTARAGEDAASASAGRPGTGAQRKDQTEGGQMEGEEETTGLSQPGSDSGWRRCSLPDGFPCQGSSAAQRSSCSHFLLPQQCGHLGGHDLPLRHAVGTLAAPEGPRCRPGQSARRVVIFRHRLLPAGWPSTAERVAGGRQPLRL
ncbi:uncharacterized protein si:ch211-67e16.4 isoform X2 [Dunckerocampus dactyliophorus]|uniref:uncharacterized protein si:ch211-67e16.4 isoform X2 n=1 Tax=Dunckerocampus dactyliophorus TaxID=161453 RepID=UPI0024058E30|nr:uncharacterized protein si:ch211-67e16.4 isoform X2 [Dunckerocampus dactyliophorus]